MIETSATIAIIILLLITSRDDFPLWLSIILSAIVACLFLFDILPAWLLLVITPSVAVIRRLTNHPKRKLPLLMER